jgi:hypothetical protein
MHVAFATQPAPGAGVNEDAVTTTDRVVVLLDGTSVPQGLEIGCRHGTAWYVAHLGTELLGQLTDQPDQLLTDALASAIQAVGSLHADTCQLDHPGGPSAAVALLREAEQTVDYLVLADATILLMNRPGSKWLAMTASPRSPSRNMRPCTERLPAVRPISDAMPIWLQSYGGTGTRPKAIGLPAAPRTPRTMP